MFKKHELYKFYVIYIDDKKISNGAKKLLKISESSFDDFKYQYEKNTDFKLRIDELVKIAQTTTYQGDNLTSNMIINFFK